VLAEAQRRVQEVKDSKEAAKQAASRNASSHAGGISYVYDLAAAG